MELLKTFRNIDNSYDKLSKLLNKNNLEKFIGNLEIKKKDHWLMQYIVINKFF